MTPLKLAILSLVRHRASTLISILAIGMAVACSGLLFRLHKVSEARFSVLGHGGDAIIGAKAGGIEILLGCLNAEGRFPDFLPYRLFQSLKAREMIQFEDGIRATASAIRSIIPFVYFGMYGHFRVVGTDDSFPARPQNEDTLALAEGNWPRNTGQVAVGSVVAKRKNLQLEDTIRIRPWIGETSLPAEIPLEVTAILEPTGTTWDRLLYTTVAQAHEVFSAHPEHMTDASIWGADVLHYYLVYLGPGDYSELEDLVNKRTVGQIIRIEEQKARLKELMGTGKKLGGLVTVIIIFLGGLAVCSMLVTRFEGMALQLAVLRALGYTKREITTWLFWEGLLLGILGVFVGMLVDLWTFPLLRSYLGGALPSPELVGSSIVDSWAVWIVAVLATVGSVFAPVMRLSTQDAHRLLQGL